MSCATCVKIKNCLSSKLLCTDPQRRERPKNTWAFVLTVAITRTRTSKVSTTIWTEGLLGSWQPRTRSNGCLSQSLIKLLKNKATEAILITLWNSNLLIFNKYLELFVSYENNLDEFLSMSKIVCNFTP